MLHAPTSETKTETNVKQAVPFFGVKNIEESVRYYVAGLGFEMTRELIDAALDGGGSYYLPYQLHATEEQFLRAYPRAPEFLVLKQRLDRSNKFRNELLDKYLRPQPTKNSIATLPVP